MVVLEIAALVVIIWLLVKSFRRNSDNSAPTQSSVKTTYPYRYDVEGRLPNGRITTQGYAARHPAEFAHWARGPENVYGENIDRHDWEEWRINYYGM